MNYRTVNEEEGRTHHLTQRLNAIENEHLATEAAIVVALAVPGQEDEAARLHAHLGALQAAHDAVVHELDG